MFTIFIPTPIIIMCIPTYKFRLRYTVVLCNFVLTLHSSPELYTSKRRKVTIHNDISLVNEKKFPPCILDSNNTFFYKNNTIHITSFLLLLLFFFI